MIDFFLFIPSFLFSLGLVPLIRQIGNRFGANTLPRGDRWQHAPVSRLGGIAIFGAFFGGICLLYWFLNGRFQLRWQLLACSALMFLVGLFDDFRPLSPPAKFIAQILISALAIAFGFSTRFFSPRIENEIIAQLPNILLTFIWLVGITNAINLLDNMDGLAAGIGLITSFFLSYFFWVAGDQALLVISMSLVGALAGFLIFNFPPASIFMGDSGSLCLGFSLAVLAIVRQPQASNVIAVMGVPTLLFLLPILDTVLVTFTRSLRGQSPIQGGRDHSSHRLIAFGLTERQTVLSLYAVALVSGIAAALLEAIEYWFSLVIVPILIVTLAVLFAYLGGVRVLPPEDEKVPNSRLTRILLDLTFRKRLLEVFLDFLLIGIAYYLAYLVENGLRMNEVQLGQFLDTLPVVLFSSYLIFFLMGVYRSVWRYFSLGDLLHLCGAAIGSGLTAAGLFFLLNSTTFTAWKQENSPTPLILVLFTLFLFLGLAASRSSFRILSYLTPRKPSEGEVSVLILGAGEAGILILDWMRLNSHLHLTPVGFIDDDPYLHGRNVHGLKVLGGISNLDSILHQRHIAGLLIAGDRNIADLPDLVKRCESQGIWIRKATLEIEPLQ